MKKKEGIEKHHLSHSGPSHAGSVASNESYGAITYPVGIGMFKFIVAGGGDCAETKGKNMKAILKHMIMAKSKKGERICPFLHLFLGPTCSLEERIKPRNWKYMSRDR